MTIGEMRQVVEKFKDVPDSTRVVVENFINEHAILLYSDGRLGETIEGEPVIVLGQDDWSVELKVEAEEDEQ